MDRGISGIYFFSTREGQRRPVCFEDLSEEEMRRILKEGDRDRAESLAIALAKKLKQICDQEGKSDNSGERAAYDFQTVNNELVKGGSITLDIVKMIDDVHNDMKAKGFYGSQSDLDNAANILRQMYSDKTHIVRDDMNINIVSNINHMLSGINRQIISYYLWRKIIINLGTSALS